MYLLFFPETVLIASDQILAVIDRYEKIIGKSNKHVETSIHENDSNNLLGESSFFDVDNLLNISENNSNLNLIDSSQVFKEQDERVQLEEVLNTWSQQETISFNKQDILQPQLLDDLTASFSGIFLTLYYSTIQ